MTNAKTLIDTLQGSLLDGRYSDITVVNRDPATGIRRETDLGSLSVVFRAYDSQSQRPVALKFFDPDIQGFGNRYRMTLFEREVQILMRVQNKVRCLQLLQGLSEVSISIETEERSITVPCGYFVLEWLDEDVVDYFLNQNSYDSLVKLLLFRNIVLGVFALHRENIAHRDIKYDNLMRTFRKNREVVLSIDLGTAIDLTSDPVGTAEDYERPVGAKLFAPIEASFGLTSDRQAALGTDIYALGCLLHDLFNSDLFTVRLYQDPGFLNCLSACQAGMAPLLAHNHDMATRRKKWNSIMQLTRNQVTLPKINSNHTTVPNAARDQLNRLLHTLSDVHYKQREYDLNKILRMIDSAVRCLENSRLDRLRQKFRTKKKELRDAKHKRKNERLSANMFPIKNGG